MRWALIFVVLLLVVFIGLFAYVRLAPTDIARFHTAGVARDPGDHATANTFTAVRAITTPAEGALTAVQTVIMQSPRTQLLAGSVEAGVMTFVTRTPLMGYPDFTTVSIIAEGAAPSGNAAPLLMIEGRARFGQSDLGVNKGRINGWLEQLGPLIASP